MLACETTRKFSMNRSNNRVTTRLSEYNTQQPGLFAAMRRKRRNNFAREFVSTEFVSPVFWDIRGDKKCPSDDLRSQNSTEFLHDAFFFFY